MRTRMLASLMLLAAACGDDTSTTGGGSTGGESTGGSATGGMGTGATGGMGTGATGGMGTGGMGGMGLTCADCDPLASCAGEPPVTCTCPGGYDDTNGDGTLCTDIDECATSTDNCDPVATCSNTDGSFTCECPVGYTDPNGDGSLCSNIDECAQMLAMCDPNVGICTDNNGSFTCSCPMGYDDTNGDGSLCTDIDECTAMTDNCDVLATCDNTPGSFTCTCPQGYDDTNGDGTLCTDIDECMLGTDNCAAVATCNNTPGAFTCTCPQGTFDTNGDGTVCDPLDLYFFSPFRALLHQRDPDNNFATVGCVAVTSPGVTITGVTAAAKNPMTGVNYVVAKVSGAPSRQLGTVDLATGVITIIGPMGSNFSSLAWTNDGMTLYGTTGNGAGVNAETLFTIDPLTGTPTLVQALGNGADGEVIAFDPAGTLYHWSGNGTVVFETIQIGTGVTPVTTSAAYPGGETFSAIYWPWHTDGMGNAQPGMLVGTISSNFRFITFDMMGVATVGPALGTLPDDPRGLIFEQPHGFQPDATNCP